MVVNTAETILQPDKLPELIPVAVLNNLNQLKASVHALEAMAIRHIEITFRTSFSIDAFEWLQVNRPDWRVFAGTVTNANMATLAIECGAELIFSPGLSLETMEVCRQSGTCYIPGVMTPTEVGAAWEFGCRIQKFYPAELAGGIRMLDALAQVYPDVRFVPTGGLNSTNYQLYLNHPAVIACGGSWMLKD